GARGGGGGGGGGGARGRGAPRPGAARPGRSSEPVRSLSRGPRGADEPSSPGAPTGSAGGQTAEQIPRRQRDPERGERMLAHVAPGRFRPFVLRAEQFPALRAEALGGVGGDRSDALHGVVGAAAEPVGARAGLFGEGF